MGKKAEGMSKLEKFIPNQPGYAIGVCLRLSVPDVIDFESEHGGLHLLNTEEIVAKIKF